MPTRVAGFAKRTSLDGCLRVGMAERFNAPEGNFRQLSWVRIPLPALSTLLEISWYKLSNFT